MFSLRDTIASALLGVKLSPAEEEVNEKKGKKKPHKKRSSKNKSKSEDARRTPTETNGQAADSQSDDADLDSDDEADITNFGHVAPSAEGMTTSALIHQFESTQIGTLKSHYPT